MKTGERKGFLVAAIVLSIAVWPIAFNLAVYQTVLYGHLFAILAASIALFLGRLLVPNALNTSNLNSWLDLGVLLLPSFWLLVEILSHDNNSEFIVHLRGLLSIGVAAISLPYIVYFMVGAMVPGVEQLQSTPLKLKLIGLVSVVAMLAYLSGEYHPYVLSCDDFSIAGSSVPANCWQP